MRIATANRTDRVPSLPGEPSPGSLAEKQSARIATRAGSMPEQAAKPPTRAGADGRGYISKEQCVLCTRPRDIRKEIAEEWGVSIHQHISTVRTCYQAHPT